MSEDRGLGGRLALHDPKSLTPAQKPLYDEIQRTAVPWAERAGFTAATTDGRLVGPFNAFLLSPEIAAAYLMLVSAESEHTSLSPRVREVVILTVGAIWNAAYELYAHAAVGRSANLPDATVQALVCGQPPPSLTPEELTAHTFTSQLCSTHQVGAPLYAEAERTFGTHGLADLIFLIGNYLGTCALLNAFDIPAPNDEP